MKVNEKSRIRLLVSVFLLSGLTGAWGYALTYTWSNPAASLPVAFNVTNGAHEVFLVIETGQTQPADPTFELYPPSTWPYPDTLPLTIYVGQIYQFPSNSGDGVAGTKTMITNESNGNYKLDIIRKPVSQVNGFDASTPIYCPAGDWILVISGLRAPRAAVTVTISSRAAGTGVPGTTGVGINTPPNPSITSPANNDPITYSGAASVNFVLDPGNDTGDGTTLRYNWNFGSGTYDSGTEAVQNPTNVQYTTSDQHDVSVVVTEVLRALPTEITQAGTAPRTFFTNRQPTATIKYRMTGSIDYGGLPSGQTYKVINAGESLDFSASDSHDDLGIDTYTWTFSHDGSSSGADTVLGKSYATRGIYHAYLTVSDNHGFTSLQADLTIVVKSAPSVSIQYKTAAMPAFADPPPPTTPPVNGVLGPDPDDPAKPPCYKLFFRSAGVDSGYPAEYSTDHPNAIQQQIKWYFTEIEDTGFVDNHKYEAVGAQSARVEVTFTVSEGNYSDNPAPVSASMDVWVTPSDTLLFPPHVGVPDLENPSNAHIPPAIDGSIDRDGGWLMAQKATYGNGGATPLYSVQALRHNAQNLLYLSVQVFEDPQEDPALDRIVLLLRPDQDRATEVSSGDRIVVINPHTNVSNYQVYHHTGSGWESVPVTNMAVKSTTVPTGVNANCNWNVEIQLPLSISGAVGGGANWIDLGSPFLLYADIKRPGFTDMTWPRQQQAPAAVELGAGDVPQSIPHPLWFGKADRVSSVYGGVFIAWGDIYTDNLNPPPPYDNVIKVNGDNTFYARVQNNTIENGVAADANGIRVTFRVANWGIQPADGHWYNFPGSGGTSNPTMPPEKIDRNNEKVFQSIWSVPAGYAPDGSHQCVMAQIDSTSSANIVTASVYNNMDFSDLGYKSFSSPQTPKGIRRSIRIAEINSQGLFKPPRGTPNHVIYLDVVKRRWSVKDKIPQDPRLVDLLSLDPRMSAILREGAAAKGATVKPIAATPAPGLEQEISYFVYEIRGYVVVGKRSVGGNELDVLEPIGSFGQFFRNDGTVEDWTFSMSGDGVAKLGRDRYRLSIPEGQKANVSIQVDAILPATLSWSVHAGGSVPLGILASSYSVGGGGILDLEWHRPLPALPDLSVRALLEADYFFAKAGGSGGLYIVGASLDARYILFSALPFSATAEAGFGPSYPQNGPWDYGPNFGAGIDYRLDAWLTFELGLGYRYLAVSKYQSLQILLGGIIRLW